MIYDFSKIICRIYPISIYIKMQDYSLDKNLVLALCSSLKRQAQAARHSIELPEILEVMMVKTDSNAIPVLYTS